MNCKECGGKLKTTDSRAASYGVRRRHKCEVCGNRVTTVEITMNDYKALVALKEANIEAKKNLNNAYCILERICALADVKGGANGGGK